MQEDVIAAEAGKNEGPTKRTRRPSVRLHEPYNENPLVYRKPQRQWNPTKRHYDGVKRPPTVKAWHLKNKKNDNVSDASEGQNKHGFNFDEDVVIGNWKNLNDSNRNRDFKRKRVRPTVSNKRCTQAKFKGTQELSSSSVGGKQREEREEYNDDGINSNLVVEDADLSNRSPSDGDDKSSDNHNNVDRNQGMQQNSLDLNKSEDNVRTRGVDQKNRHCVRAWLNKLGLDKYAPVFEVHEVDDGVLEQLTLEDLKDMGISAVGSRRKMYASIQHLRS